MSSTDRRDPRDTKADRPLAQLAAAVEQSIRVIHMADPNGHLHGLPRGTSCCRVCIDPATLLHEVWPCPTVRTVRRLTRAVEGGRA